MLFASAGEGDFIFPSLHHAPDALFAVGKLLELLARAERPLAEVAKLAPTVPVARVTVPCPVERKGEVMRRFGERVQGLEVSYLEGIKVLLDGGWVLLRPDRVAPTLHLHAESASPEAAQKLVRKYREEVQRLVRSA